MAVYLLKRLLLFFPTLLVIAIITFLVSTQTPGDPVERMVGSGQSGDGGLRAGSAHREAYQRTRQQLGLHLPVFYLSLTRMPMPDTLSRIPEKHWRSSLHRITERYGNWAAAEAWYHAWLRAESVSALQPASDTVVRWRSLLFTLGHTQRTPELFTILNKMDSLATGTSLDDPSRQLDEALTLVVTSATPWKSYIPSIRWHGTHNQFHRWLVGVDGYRGLLRGNLGTSYRSGRPVVQEISRAVGITLRLSLAAIMLSLLLAVPLGVLAGGKPGSPADRIGSGILFLLYAVPAFWAGTLLIIFFGGGDFFSWFPPYGLGDTYGLSTWEAIQVQAHHLVLPVLCMVYPTLAYLSRQARGGIVSVMQQPYIRTAWAKGLSPSRVLWRHGFRNALLPVITLMAGLFPFAIGGSLVVEVVFSINGMGKLTLDAMNARDYPIVFGVVILTATFTLLGYLVSDLLYARADPRIRLGQTGKV